VREGHPVTHLFLLVTGFAASYKATLDGRKLFLRWISPGDAFGLAALLQTEPPPYFTTVQAAVRGDSVFVWERVSAHALLSQVPRLRENAYALTSNYVITLAGALAARASQTAQAGDAVTGAQHMVNRPALIFAQPVGRPITGMQWCN